MATRDAGAGVGVVVGTGDGVTGTGVAVGGGVIVAAGVAGGAGAETSVVHAAMSRRAMARRGADVARWSLTKCACVVLEHVRA